MSKNTYTVLKYILRNNHTKNLYKMMLSSVYNKIQQQLEPYMSLKCSTEDLLVYKSVEDEGVYYVSRPSWNDALRSRVRPLMA